MADREREAVQRGLELARDGVGGAARRGVVRARGRARAPGRRCRSGPSSIAAIEPGAAARAARSAAASTRARQSSSAGAKWCARTTIDDRAGLDVDAELGRARDDVAAVGDLAVQHGAQEAGLRGLGGALGRAHALDLGGDQRGDDAQQRGRRLAGAPAQPQPADGRVADAQLVRRRRRARRPSARARRPRSARRPRARRSSGRSGSARRRARATPRAPPRAAPGPTRPRP